MENNITARKARKLVVDWLEQRKIPHGKMAARTIDFTDLARCSRIFVNVAGWKPDPIAGELEEFVKSKGFYVQFSGPGIIQGSM